MSKTKDKDAGPRKRSRLATKLASGSKKSPRQKGPQAQTAMAAPTEDDVTVVESGPFAHAQCACGWAGPGRRSRKLARADAADHRAGSCPANPPR